MHPESDSHTTANDEAGSSKSRETAFELRWRLFAAELLMSWIPPFVASRIRTHALKLAGVEIGKSSFFWGLPTLVGHGAIEKQLRVGSHCGFNKGCFFDLEESITIGDHVAVGHDVMFLTRGVPPTSDQPPLAATTRAPITIGNGVWLGARSTILSGVTVGASSVIGAGVTVTRDVPENTLLTGASPISLARWR